MHNEKRLRARDREFLDTVKRAIFVNPFSDDRRKIDLQIMEMLPELDISKGEGELAQKVAAKLSELVGDKDHAIAAYQEEDKELLKYGVLFSVYHRFCDDLDRLIIKQKKAGSASCQVEFAEECLTMMARQGIREQEAVRFFGLFFQLRRAFYFINLIVGESHCMKELRLSLWNNVFTHDIGLYERYLWDRMEDFSTMLLGETGTGKGMAATAIGRSGFIPYDSCKGCFAESFTRAFVSLNLSQYPEQLLESELFGHQKGSFTGAVDSHEGGFARCSPHGAIFLDEIGEVSVPVQIKLLGVLQERTFCAVGSHQQQRFQGRVIGATNQNLNSLRLAGRFRDDFYYRLCSDIIQVPPLRQRLQDDPVELTRLLTRTIERILGTSAPDLVESVRVTIHQTLPADYHWPGNVRELEQCVRRILLKQGYEGDSGKNGRGDSTMQLLIDMEQGTITIRELSSLYCKQLHQRLGSYEAVARKVGIDRRTVKKYIDSW